MRVSRAWATIIQRDNHYCSDAFLESTSCQWLRCLCLVSNSCSPTQGARRPHWYLQLRKLESDRVTFSPSSSISRKRVWPSERPSLCVCVCLCEVLVEDKNSDCVLCAGLEVCFPSTRVLSFQQKATSINEKTNERRSCHSDPSSEQKDAASLKLRWKKRILPHAFSTPLKKEILKTALKGKKGLGF
jgi:hypothetical protein